jgi:sugar lactone lactonase YvrE
MTNPIHTLIFALSALLTPLAHADQGSFINSGGSTAISSGVSITSTAAAPAGTLTLNCPATGPTSCAGGSLTYSSNDGTANIAASFTAGTFIEGCSGGGKGGHVTCAYTFTGYFSGTWTVNGRPQALIGVTYQSFGTGGAAAQGTTAFNSAYTPFYYSDSEQIHRSDDLKGTNQISFGSQGGGVGQFYGAYGIALDSAGRIYVADTYNCRVVRFDDMNGTNWTSYGGTCGAGQGQFYDPSGVAVDPAGKIYVMDTGNSRLVRIDDLNGSNWITLSAVGSGVGQLSSFISVAVDSRGRIYVPDTGNRRIVRMDDMTGTNWTVLMQSPPVNGVSSSFQSPAAVAIDPAGRIYVADNEYQPAVIRVDDMTGTNWTSIYTGSGSGLNSISVDSSGTVFTGGGGARLVDNMAAVLTSSGSVGPIGSYYVFGVTSIPLPSPRPSAVSFAPATLSFSQNVGTSGALPLTIANFGGSPLDFSNISANGGFTETNNCPTTLPGGSSCTVSVSFAPSVAGPASGLLTVTDDSGNLGAAQAVTLSGLGTAPTASVTPATVSFQSQVLNTTSQAKSVVLQNTGTGPLQVSSVTAAAPFSQTNNCTASIAPGASCTVQVSFTPTALGSASGTLTIADNAGTQTVGLTGNGSAPVSLSSSTLNLGTVAVGYTSAARTVTLTNRAGVSLTFSSIVTTTGFAVASNTCGAGIAAGATCTVGVTFSPTAIGSATGTLTFTDSAASSPQTVTLSGTGSTPITLSSNSLNLGTVVVGSTSAVRTVSLTNRETAALNFAGVAASAGFAVASNTCGASIAGGATCTVAVTFSPTAVGAATGTLTFTDDAANSPQTVSLSGTGTAPVTLSSSSLYLGTVTVGSTSGARTVTLTNHQKASLNFTSIAASAGFAVASNTCGASIAAGANCTVGVTFSPTAAGDATGTLIFTDDAPNSPQTLSLTGTGK